MKCQYLFQTFKIFKNMRLKLFFETFRELTFFILSGTLLHMSGNWNSAASRGKCSLVMLKFHIDVRDSQTFILPWGRDAFAASSLRTCSSFEGTLSGTGELSEDAFHNYTMKPSYIVASSHESENTTPNWYTVGCNEINHRKI